MRARRGFALAAVLAALVITAMAVAVGAQRALVAARQAALDVAAAELAAAVSTAQVAALDEPVDSLHLRAITPGALLARGEVVTGRALAQWQLLGAAAPFAMIEVEASVPVFGGTARRSHRGLVTSVADTSGALSWSPAGGLGWTRVPSH